MWLPRLNLPSGLFQALVQQFQALAQFFHFLPHLRLRSKMKLWILFQSSFFLISLYALTVTPPNFKIVGTSDLCDIPFSFPTVPALAPSSWYWIVLFALCVQSSFKACETPAYNLTFSICHLLSKTLCSSLFTHSPWSQSGCSLLHALLGKPCTFPLPGPVKNMTWPSRYHSNNILQPLL